MATEIVLDAQRALRPDPAVFWAHTMLPVLLTRIVGSVDTAVAWAELIAAFPDLDVDQVRQIGEQLAQERNG